jgi:4-hydroxybenzoate polyprenyltransferase
MAAPEVVQLGFWARWATYFSERFPPLQYAIALGVFSFATLAYSAASAGLSRFPGAYASFIALLVAFLTFLQLRIHDEFKDFEEDSRYRPERPVPRGLVTLESLSRLGLFAAGVQFVLSATLGTPQVVLLIAILAYSWLMRFEFFVRPWLKRHAGAYLLLHMLIVPLITLYVALCGAAVAIERLGWYLAFCYFSFCVFEIGRKVWAPDEERTGVETYTAMWGRHRAVAAWLGAIYASAATGMAAARTVGVAMPVAVTGLVIGLLATAVGVWFAWRLAPVRGAWFRAFSALWFLGIHAVMGGAIVRGF